MAADLRIPLVIASLCLIWISGSASLSSRELLGVAPQDEGYYQSNVIKCKDGSKKFTREQLNDDFCDCPDGTDEPGTSACPEGKFYCKNAGHAPLKIFSSRVNDGICDCCDGSDEYDGKVRCANTCWEAGKVAREKLKKKIATYQDGVVIRKQEVENAKLAFAKDEGQLSKLKSEEKILKDLVQKLKEHKERIEKAEEEERLKKEKEEKKLREAERKVAEQDKPLEESLSDNTHEGHDKLPESHDQDAREGGQDTVEAQINSNDETKHVAEDHYEATVKSRSDDDVRSDTASASHAANQHPQEDEDDTMLEVVGDDDDGTTNEATFPEEHSAEQEHSSDDTDGLTKEELGRLVASRWGEKVAQKTSTVDNNNMNEEEHEDNQDIQDSAEEDDNHGYSSENEDGHKYEDDEFGHGSDDEYEEDHVEPTDSYSPDEDDKTDSSEFTTSTSPSWLEKVQQSVQNILQTFNFFKTPVDISEAARVRKEYGDSSSKLSKIQSRISSLNEKLKYDFGKEKEFYSFYDHCFESKQNKYVYKVCPFKKASQVEGHSTTQLGTWDKFDESYRVMQFANGDKCWNGPDRSMKVRLRCGLKNELADIDEPSRCEYFGLLSTPALCLEDKLKELQQKLELMNTNQPVSHDEL